MLAATLHVRLRGPGGARHRLRGQREIQGRLHPFRLPRGAGRLRSYIFYVFEKLMKQARNTHHNHDYDHEEHDTP